MDYVFLMLIIGIPYISLAVVLYIKSELNPLNKRFERIFFLYTSVGIIAFVFIGILLYYYSFVKKID